MKTPQVRFPRVLAALVFGLAAFGASAQVAVVVNPKSPTAAMTADQVAGIFLGKSSTLPSGATAAAVDQAESAAIRETFYT